MPSRFTLSPKALAGPGYIILNAIRVMNIIGFLAVIAANAVMLIKTQTATTMWFFQALSHVVLVASSIFLILSELSICSNWFARNWPLLSHTHSFATLSLAMLVIGITVLGDLNSEAGSQKALGMAFWRIAMGAGILMFILGWLNLFASFIFRDRQHGITARQVRAHGAVALLNPASNKPASLSTSEGGATYTSPSLSKPYLFNPKTPPTVTSSTTNHRLSPTLLPSYQTAAATGSTSPAPSTTSSSSRDHDKDLELGLTNTPGSPTSKYSRATACTKKNVFTGFLTGRRSGLGPQLPVNVSSPPPPMPQMEISAPLNVNPQFAHLIKRPDSALHPSQNREGEVDRWRF